MSAKNVDALKQAIAAGQQDRIDDFISIFDEDVVWDAADVPGGKRYGHDGVREFFRHWVGTFDEFRFEAREFIDADDSVFVHMRQWGRGRTSGAPVEIDLWQVWLFFEGKVVRFRQYESRDKALEAVGLSE